VSSLEALCLGLQALHANPLRSGLTTLGMVIGVAAVILVVSIGSGAREAVVNEIRSLGSNLLIIEPYSTQAGGPGARLSESDAESIAQEIAGIEVAVPTVHSNVQVVHGDLNSATTLYGVGSGFLRARDWDVEAGRGFGNEDTVGKFVLLGQTVARTLFGDTDPIGAVVRVQRIPFTVVGVLAAKGQTTSGKNQDDVVVAPIRTVMERFLGGSGAGSHGVDTMLVKVSEGLNMTQAEQEVRALLRERHHLQPHQDDDFSIKNLADVLAIKESAARVLALVVAAIASVSLLVGGIGIMNIMLVSVMERTREIGIRLAVGARERDILAQFLVEAATLSGIGALIGVPLGIVGAGAIAAAAHWPWVISLPVMALAVGFGVVIGVVFGYYPARRAAGLDPIEALRQD
jgi:ABC-type antimicrobial peptide transport system permease subunit